MNKMFYLMAATSTLFSIAAHADTTPVSVSEHRIPAVKLINTADNHSAFIRGSVPSLAKMDSKDWYFSNTFEEWQKGVHPAPKKQYVVTLKGHLQFKVSDGSTFMIEPGTVLLANDTEGEGHSWDIIGDKEWERVYLPVEGDDHFVPDAP